jgi:DNA repair exonuclease SbcCD ATPase subunit
VPTSCPICEQPIPSTVGHCSVCGFPTGLAIEGLRSIGPNGATASELESPLPLSEKPPAPVIEPPSAEAEMCATISRDIRGKLDYVRELGRGAPDVTNDMCQAALSEAEGRVTEALDVLRRAQQSLDRQTGELLQRRLASLQEREAALRETGVRFALGPDLKRLEDAIESGQREVAAGSLVETERRVTQFESDWRGLQGLLRQIDTLRKEATELGIPLGEISGEVSEIRDQLRGPDLTEDALDSVAQAAAQTLMLLHEAIPTSLEEELGRHESVLGHYPEDHPPSAAARRLHTEATRHLKKGRLSDAVQSVRELRREIDRLEQSRELHEVAVGVGETAPAPPVEAPVETEAETLNRLLKKARSLAGRVRTLPPESELAREAAAQIRDVTELLRARELRGADQALARLMRMLSAEQGGT